MINAATAKVKIRVLSFPERDISGLKRTRAAGKNVKFRTKAREIPMVMVQPKSITGLIPLKTKDVNAQIVVKAVYKQGQTIFFVGKTSLFIIL